MTSLRPLVLGKAALRRLLRDPFLSRRLAYAHSEFPILGLDFALVIAPGVATRAKKTAGFEVLNCAEEFGAVFGFQAGPAHFARLSVALAGGTRSRRSAGRSKWSFV
jgi:hypothetical protein